VKRNEFIKEHKAIFSVGAEAAAALAVRAGVKWDPEEPELPRRLTLTPNNAYIVDCEKLTEDSARFLLRIDDPQGLAVAVALIHLYNRRGELLALGEEMRDLDPPVWRAFGERLLAILNKTEPEP
jgi:hypothetical protein